MHHDALGASDTIVLVKKVTISRRSTLTLAVRPIGKTVPSPCHLPGRASRQSRKKRQSRALGLGLEHDRVNLGTLQTSHWMEGPAFFLPGAQPLTSTTQTQTQMPQHLLGHWRDIGNALQVNQYYVMIDA